jgi:WD40 repeat protein
MVCSVAISNDGGRIISGSVAEGRVKVWDSRSGQELLTLKGHTHYVDSVVISSDGGRILCGNGDGRVTVWDGRSGQELLTLKGYTNGVSRMAISCDGGHIVCGSVDKDVTVQVWDIRFAQDWLVLRGPTARLRSVALSTDCKHILGKEKRGTILAWDSRSGQPLVDVPEGMPSFGPEARSADGKLQASIEDGRIRVRRADLEENRKLREKRDREFLERLAR